MIYCGIRVTNCKDLPPLLVSGLWYNYGTVFPFFSSSFDINLARTVGCGREEVVLLPFVVVAVEAAANSRRDAAHVVLESQRSKRGSSGETGTPEEAGTRRTTGDTAQEGSQGGV